jgi:hypothetical protein
MPVISRFFGISIVMYHRDHQPPHFHAKYGDAEATVEIATGLAEGKPFSSCVATGQRMA